MKLKTTFLIISILVFSISSCTKNEAKNNSPLEDYYDIPSIDYIYNPFIIEAYLVEIDNFDDKNSAFHLKNGSIIVTTNYYYVGYISRRTEALLYHWDNFANENIVVRDGWILCFDGDEYRVKIKNHLESSDKRNLYSVRRRSDIEIRSFCG